MGWVTILLVTLGASAPLFGWAQDSRAADALPPGWHAHLPSRDGDLLQAASRTVPRASVSVEEVRREIVEPILKAIGCPGSVTLEAPSEGVLMPRADAARLARAMRVPDGIGGSSATRRLGSVSSDLERQQVVYPFHQVHQGTPIQPGGIVVTRWDGQSPSAVRGSVFCLPRVENTRRLLPEQATAAAILAVGPKLGIDRARGASLVDTPVPILWPVGIKDAERRTVLRHAYRLTLALSREARGLAEVWVDAETGQPLALATLVGAPSADAPDAVPARKTVRALVWRRDPGVGRVVAEFDIDEAGAEGYVLSRARVMSRLRDNDGSSPVSSATPDFARPPYDDWAKALCTGGTDSAFHQLNVAAAALRAYDVASAQGLGWPILPWEPSVGGHGCASDNGMVFQHCAGYRHPRCPTGHLDGVNDEDPFDPRNLLSWAEDNTVIVHETAHTIVPTLTFWRPRDWCGRRPCAMPRMWSGELHDLADFWADHLEWTNCFGGWVGRNLRGPKASADCRRHSESRWLPRRHEVQVPFVPGDPRDHFPEHRHLYGGDEYADGQIGAAALWEVRAGMLSIAGAAGVAQFGVRLQRAVTLTGFTPPTTAHSDASLYRTLYDLQLQLADQWATALKGAGDPGTLNKLTSGFARAGLFLIPLHCLDGDPSTTDPTVCPSRDHGGDAVIDVDDRDRSDDPRAEGVRHRESDYLKLRGRRPRFHVWTGPLYRFAADGRAGTDASPLCNTRFAVEVSSDPSFLPEVTVSSGSRKASRCYGSWKPSRKQWRRFQVVGAGGRLYYRARTDAGWPGSERLSTAPGAGLWTVPPPYAVLTVDGKPTY